MDNQTSSRALTVAGAAGGELAQFGEMSVATIVDRKRKIAEVMKAVMTEGEHYGKIPGCGDKPTLYKAGAEVLATTFGLAPTFKITRTDLANGHREYEIVCTLHHIATGAVVGEGVGCGSTMESKYRWRRGERKCPKCGKSGTVLKSKNDGEGYFCWRKKDGCGATFALGDKSIESQETGRAENPDIADVYNTVLKMAKKRAQVDCTLTAVGASDLLTQDLEDLPPASGGDRDVAPAKPDLSSAPPAGEKLDKAKEKVANKSKKKQDAAAGGVAADADPNAVPFTEDETIDLIEQISRCGTKAAVDILAAKSRDRVLKCDEATRVRIRKACHEQLAQIREADRAEKRAS